MAFKNRKVPFSENLLDRLSDDLLAVPDPTRALVLLPSSRACRSLGHLLLERGGSEAMLLPRILTPGQLEGDLTLALGLDETDLPGDRSRPLLLAHRLKDEPWLADRRESAPGLAREFVDLFDEVRRCGRQGEILEAGGLNDLSAIAGARAAAQQEEELERIRRVWALYRAVVPRDGLDLLVEVSDRVSRPENQAAVAAVVHADHLLVAGFASVDPLRAAVLLAASEAAGDSELYLAEAQQDLSRFFCATWTRAGSGGLDPLAPGRLVRGLLVGDEETDTPATDTGSLRDRVDALGDRGRFWAPDGALEVLACGTVEDESLVVADRVIRILSQPGGAEERTAIVSNDPQLAARVVAQLRDAGVDTDQTLGAPLSGLPAGLLLRFILRTALTDFRPDSLLEVITHPFVEVGTADQRGEFWALSLERMLRRQQGTQLGAEGMRRVAASRDEAARTLAGDEGGERQPGLEDYVLALQAAFQPLTGLAGQMFLDWGEALRAVRETWAALCPEWPLFENRERSDLTALARLLDDLEKDAALLPPTSLAALTADIGRLLSAESVAPHRGQAKPVLVTGTVEARLETFDHLFLCGMADGSFPARRARPLFLNATLRRHLDLPDWRGPNARDAELFLRLLHNAPRVLVTWPTEGDGRGILPSPFVERLCLALPEGQRPPLAETPRPWRREEDRHFDPTAAQAAFAAEGLTPEAIEDIGPLNRLSWSALQKWRDCHYRHLLARGLRLEKEEEVREEFGRRDFGSLVHLSLCRFLDPEDEGYQALLAGRGDDAEARLRTVAREVFLEQGDDTALRRLWLENFLRGSRAIVDVEVERFKTWRPVLREHTFEVSLADLLERVRALAMSEGYEGTVTEAADGDAEIILRGSIDRVDHHVDGLGGDAPVAAVIDYKTGKIPTTAELEKLEDLQIVLYALVLEATAPGTTVREGSYYAIGEHEAGPPARAQLPASGRDLLIRGGLELVRMARAAADPQATFDLIPRQIEDKGPAGLPCTWCDLRGVCRLEEKRGLPGPVAVRVDQLVNRKEGAW